jgi:hypothetical protein
VTPQVDFADLLGCSSSSLEQTETQDNHTSVLPLPAVKMALSRLLTSSVRATFLDPNRFPRIDAAAHASSVVL